MFYELIYFNIPNITMEQLLAKKLTIHHDTDGIGGLFKTVFEGYVLKFV